jgi:hydroxyacylglutathione hydrolase
VPDRTRADEPWFLLTGHTLMVGDLGRTEQAPMRKATVPQCA